MDVTFPKVLLRKAARENIISQNWRTTGCYKIYNTKIQIFIQQEKVFTLIQGWFKLSLMVNLFLLKDQN